MIPIIIATILLVLWITGLWYFNDKKTPQSVANNPFRLPICGRIIWLIVAWAVTFLIVPVARIHAANPLRFFVLLAGGCMVMVGALPIHEDEDGIGGALYNLFSIGTILFTQALVSLSTPLVMLTWLPSAVYWGVCIYRAKDWPSWRLWIGITAYAVLAMEFLL